ncbi:MAG TPA: hypothetical protein VHB30_12700 [Solirubrobacteraceae bacterium]|jgi:hypothetical protein|nr:hypothetical protein [Solirubrobacteraceae bacterium]
MSQGEFRVDRSWSEQERSARSRLVELFRAAPIPDDEILVNLGLFATRPALTKLLFLHDVYRSILDVHGVVLDLGARWGQALGLFESFRGMYEPYNYTRRLVGFDTFEGFAGVGEADVAAEGEYGVTPGYEDFLAEVLRAREDESPLAHIPKFELVKGDATETVPRWLDEHPEAIVALACFDLDLYEPTRACLEAIRPRLTKGSVLLFGVLNSPQFPGDTMALRDVLGLDRYAIKRSPRGSYQTYIVVE